MLRAFHSHKCGLCSCPGIKGICELSLLLVLSLAPRGFSLGTPVFPSKTNSTPIQSGMVDQEPLCGCATLKSFLFIYFSKFTLGTSIFFLATHLHYVLITSSATYPYTIMSGDSSNLCRAFLIRRFPWFSYLI